MLHYTISGSGSAPLVMLHGFLENSSIWNDMQEHLAEAFTLIKIDLPGHGKSEMAEDFSMEGIAEKVLEVTNSLNLETFHLLGHSMGGYISLAFAAKFPEKLQSLTLFFSTFLADDAQKKDQRDKSLRIISDSLPTYVNTAIPNLFSENEKDILQGKIETAKKIAVNTQMEAAKKSVTAMKERKDMTSLLATLPAKIVLLAGRHDNAINSSKTLQLLPDKTNIKAYLLDCGHNGHWEKPAICASIINTELLHHLPKSYTF